MNDKPNFTLKKSAVLATLITATLSAQAEETINRASAMELPDLDVVGTTPLPGTGLPIEKYAGNVQLIDSETIEEQNAVDLSETLFRNIGSIDINSSQNNPYQNDVHYRGFLASPLVGSAIGVSAFVDGVRVNEGFGDTVNWDLIPDFAISNISLIPGSNPLFGLNTLGGALSLQTKSGFQFDGTQLSLSIGDFGRRELTLEHGGNKGNFDYYFGGNLFKEDGWRQRSPSDVRQIFSKVGWENEVTDIDLSYTFADNDLIGNGFVPESHLAADRASVYTFPDQTKNSMHFVNLRGSHWLNDNLLAAANVFYRHFQRSTLNGDAEVECVADGLDEALFVADEAGEDPTNPATELRRVHNANCDNDDIQNAVIGSMARTPFDPLSDEAELEVEGEERNTFTETDSWGGTLQFSHDGQIAGRENTLVVGAAYDQNKTNFSVSEADADLFQDGIAFGTIDAEEQEIDVDIETEKRNWALFFTDTIDLMENLAFTVSGRYQHSTVDILDLTGEEENQDLNGSHSFSRFNPAFGLSYNPISNLTVYGAYNESFRVPTAAELTCADPDDPCNLPNSFVADPPLDPVIGKTFEIGARGKLPALGNLFWNAALFRTNLEDDLLFTTVSSAGAGFFVNVDETRRQGVELGLGGLHNNLTWFANYSYIDATFESDERLASVVDPNGLYVKAGDQIPAIPEHNVKLGASYSFNDRWRIGASLTYASSSYMRGDENNQLPKVDDYTIFNMTASYTPTDVVEIWAKVDNVFDTDYDTSGIRNFNAFPVNGGDIQEERFLSPGAPRAAYVGVKVRF
jgi:outer membrane receptor protein involved in Fe transport